ncbi:MAG: HlyD family type I secretion periplasmic adaptor subunit, partial [Alphaproteobacteria bacterium]|nr:HlyD family type I secretion periplasmic adaptor subunit [Alphaproteobacteria bacterium]
MADTPQTPPQPNPEQLQAMMAQLQAQGQGKPQGAPLGLGVPPEEPKPSIKDKIIQRLLVPIRFVEGLLGFGKESVEERKAKDIFSVLGRRPEDAEDDPPTDLVSRLFFWVFSVTCVSFIIWINVGTLDVVSMTQGEVIPSTSLKTLQHLEGGIVLEISAKEGEAVKKGQQLVVLEPTVSDADVAELNVRLDSLGVDIIRLQAEAEGNDNPAYTEDLIEKYPNLVAQAIERFDIRKKSQASKIESQKQIIRQRQNEETQIASRLQHGKSALRLQNEQISISKGLIKNKLTTRYDHLELLKKANELKGNIEADESALRRSKNALSEARSQMQSIDNAYRQEARAELDKTRLEFRELSQRQRKFTDSLIRTVLRSPVDGIIKTLYVNTIGGVVKAGDNVVDIVPGEDRLVVESQLPTTDIGHIQIGQEAVIKLTSSDAARYGDLEGIVTAISPDTILSPEGNPYYKVRVETKQSYFQRGKWKYQLYPGMQLMTNIRTGERTVFEYLFEPL